MNAPDDLLPVRRFKLAMRRFGASVSVITTAVDGAPHGMTATAVCSLSAEPPSLVVCINRGAATLASIRARGAFCVNTLASGQAGIASRFAGGPDVPRAARFDGVTWRGGVLGVPVIDGCAAALECVLDQAVECATHVILVGAVREIHLGDSTASLLYLDGRYCAAAPLAA